MENSFTCNNHEYAIGRFLCILQNIKEGDYGWYDIGVVETQIGERLTANEDLIGIEVLPIVELFPVTYWVADSFEEFLCKLA